jgi:holo-[acyl-carrier protein] synthase
MIIGLGEDLVAIDRIQKLIESKGDAFLKKCFTAAEIKKAALHNSIERTAAYYAKRFAAKEACLKAMGTGMRDGLSWHDMDIDNDELGRPVLNISGGVAERLKNMCDHPALHITLSDEAVIAHATVIIETRSTVQG